MLKNPEISPWHPKGERWFLAFFLVVPCNVKHGGCRYHFQLTAVIICPARCRLSLITPRVLGR